MSRNLLKSKIPENENEDDDDEEDENVKLLKSEINTTTNTNSNLPKLSSSWVGGLRKRAQTYRDKLMSNKFAVTSKFVVCSKVFTETIPSRNCDVLMTLPDSTSEDVIMWLVTRLRARVPELVLHLRHHNKTEEFGFYMTASHENLLKGADELALKKPVKAEFGGGCKEFVYEDREYFEGALDGGRSFLNSEERQNIIRHLLMNLRALEGDELEGIKFLEGQAIVPILLSRNVISQVLPLHCHDDLTYLRNNWVRDFFHKQPLDKVCDYFGVKIAMYFAYLGHYTKCLLWPAIIGFVLWFLAGSNQYTDDICFVAFAFFNVGWATLYLEGWKRTEAVHAYHWGTMDREDELLVEPRALYHGPLITSAVTGREEPHYPSWRRNLFRYFVSAPVMLMCLTFVFGVMWVILEFQSFINKRVEADKIPTFCKFIPKILLACCISVMDGAYKKIATWLNDMENYRLEINYENNLIIKLVLFQFVNSFLSLFYIAFYLQDMDQLQDHLGALLITRQVIGNLKETIQPYVLERIKLFRMWYHTVVSMSADDLQRLKRKKPRRRGRKRDRSSDSGGSSGGESGSASGGSSDNFAKISSEAALDDVLAASARKRDVDDDNVAVAVTWRGNGMTIGSIKEEEEEEEEEAVKRHRDIDVRSTKSESAVTEATAAAIDDEDETRKVPTISLPTNDSELFDSQSDYEEDDEDDDAPEVTIRESGSAVPGGLLGRGVGMDVGGVEGPKGKFDRKVSLMEDVRGQLPQLKRLSQEKVSRRMSQAEVESIMKKYEDTYEDYLEMFIQFGYVTLFSSAFPLAALCAFVNNTIEIRSDAFKLCISSQRPFGQRVENIGIWQGALELMSIIAVIVNSALIGMSGLVERIFPDWGTAERILFIVILEHAVLSLKIFVAYAIPDIPDQVAEERARLEFMRREALKKQKRSFRICKR